MSQTRPYYLDAAATTRVDSRVAALVMQHMIDEFGNAGSRTHQFGLDAQRAVTRARRQIAEPLGSEPDDVLFTSGATESNNLAILGLAQHGRANGRRHLVATAIEHKAVLEPLGHLTANGFELTLVAPERSGHVAADAVLAAVRDDTLLVSVMHGNNETGALQPIEAIAGGLAGAGPYLHVDAAQTFGKATPELRHPRIDLIALSGHKIYAPKGIGALVARRRAGQRPPLAPLMYGGGQERGLRPGTQPVPLIAGIGLASEIGERERAGRMALWSRMRDEAIAAFAPLGATVHGDPARTLPNILSIMFPGLDSEAVMLALQDVAAVSNGSACTSASYAPSHVLYAMGLTPAEIQATVRFSWAHDEKVNWCALAEAVTIFA